jgi:transglutaminase-like putative cysteine protease
LGVQQVGGDNPLGDLGEDLRQNSTNEVLRYTTNTAQPLYLRLTTLTLFDGYRWSHLEYDPMVLGLDPNGQQLQPIPGASFNAGGKPSWVEIEVKALRSEWVPAPYAPQTIAGLNGQLTIDQGDLSLSLNRPVEESQVYSVESALPQEPGTSGAQINGENPYVLEIATNLPDNMPPSIGETARQIAATTDGSDYAMARALEQYFLNSGFKYSLQAPAQEGYDGDTSTMVAQFLEAKSGYCIHFAVAMTLMARELGLPARVAVGYLPGRPVATATPAEPANPSSPKTRTYSVTANRLHSWPEVYIEGSGWMNFEPTVSMGASSPTTPASPKPSARPSVARTASPRSAAPKTDQSSSPQTPATSHTPLAWAGWSLLSFGLLTLVAATPGLWRQTLRRRRLHSGLAGAWTEIHATARDLGLVLPAHLTPAELAQQLASVLRAGKQDQAATQIEDLTGIVEEVAYSPHTPAATSNQTGRHIVRALIHSQPTRARLHAWWLPQSLLRRHRSQRSGGTFRR